MLGRVLIPLSNGFAPAADLGYVSAARLPCRTTAQDIELAVRESLARANLIISTGGLGPTF